MVLAHRFDRIERFTQGKNIQSASRVVRGGWCFMYNKYATPPELGILGIFLL